MIVARRCLGFARSLAALVAAHEGLSENDSAALNARLVLLLANHIGDQTVLQSLIEQAQR